MAKGCPIGFSPDDILDVYTSLDAHLPDDQRTVFLARALTPRQIAAIGAGWKQEHATGDAENTALNTAILRAFTGWRNPPTDETNTPLPWTADGLDQGLTTASKYQLLRELDSSLFIAEHLKKKLRSQPGSAPAESPTPTTPTAPAAATFPSPSISTEPPTK